MGNVFLIGLGFAASEHGVRAVAENLRRFSASKLTANLIFEAPPFFAFAFIAGVGAEWVSDQSANHAFPLIVTTFIWLGSLACRWMLMENGLHLEEVFRRKTFKNWATHFFILSTLSCSISLTPYFIWMPVALPKSVLIASVTVLLITYIILAFFYLSNLNAWETEKCSLLVRDRITIYCKRLPDENISAASNPALLETMEYWFLDAKCSAARIQYQAFEQCCCLEDKLVEAVRACARLQDGLIRNKVREIIKEIGLEIQLDYQALNLIVGDEAQYSKAKDILLKSQHSINVPIMENIRKKLLESKR